MVKEIFFIGGLSVKTLLKNVNSKVLFKQISKYDAIYFSGITLSIYDQKSNEKF